MTDGTKGAGKGGERSPGAGTDGEAEARSAATGVPARGELDARQSYSPMGGPGIRHWKEGYISRPGLDDRSSVFFTAVEMTRMPMLVTDPNQQDNPIVFANMAFLDLTQYSEDEVIGRNCRFLQGPQTDRDVVDEIRSAVRDQRAIAVDLLNYKRDGSPFWNALFLGPIFDQTGKLLYFFASQMDVTRRRTSEQAFRQAQKMEAIGQLTAGLAHDFNNLLQVISGNLEIAAGRAGGDSLLRRSIEHAERAAEQGAKLTQQLLTFARKQRLDPRRVNLNSLVVDFSEMLVRTLGSKVDLRLDLKPGLPSCTLDTVHLEMALLNVLINARDAMPKGGKATVATATLNLNDNGGDGGGDNGGTHNLPPGHYAVLCIHDEGHGMPPEVLQRATEPFFTTKTPGTGLGLAMVHGFVQQSHGRMEIESAPGRGTTVRMIFPIDSDQRAGSPRRAARDEIPVDPAVEAGRQPAEAIQTILLVEDNDDVSHLAENYLRSLGYRVLTAGSGEEAMELLTGEDAAVDLLFTDLVMPGGMNGLVLAERVRERIPGIPVLLATGYTDDLVLQNANTMQSMDIMNKPYRRIELADRIRAALAKSTGRKPNDPAYFRHEG
jgi:PAS domain S-box-containing protein